MAKEKTLAEKIYALEKAYKVVLNDEYFVKLFDVMSHSEEVNELINKHHMLIPPPNVDFMLKAFEVLELKKVLK